MSLNERFHIMHERTIMDNDNGVGFVCSYKSDAEEVCRLLNDLNNENEQLKQSDTITDLETQIMKLKQENEELKKILKRYEEDEFERTQMRGW